MGKNTKMLERNRNFENNRKDDVADISLKILFLNDILRSGIIDKDIYAHVFDEIISEDRVGEK